MNHPVIIIPLSRNEEDMLRLVSHGVCPTQGLRSDDLDQLTRLGLVEQQDGKASLTAFGGIRLAQIKDDQLRSMIRAARARHIAGQAA